jgi:hypothetical protein
MRLNMYLDSFTPLEVEVGYGELGIKGRLGYEGKTVSARGRAYEHALSAHPPARLLFQLDGRFNSFRSLVALNDDVPAGCSYANFAVLADGREVAVAPRVMAGELPRLLQASIGGARQLELLVRTNSWDHSHAVWLDPQVSEMATSATAAGAGAESKKRLLDCLERAEIELPEIMPVAERCVATVVSPGFEHLLDDMLGSLRAHGRCEGALLVVFTIEPNETCKRVVEKHGATLIRCHRRANVNPTVKSVLYTAARVIEASQFLCLDADMLVLGDLRPVFAALEACPEDSLLACREANSWTNNNLGQALHVIYGGRRADLPRLLIKPDSESSYGLVVNDGLFAGNRTALLALDGLIRGWTRAPAWVDERKDIWWRNQFIFNLALARMRCGVELDATYNVQLNSQEVRISSAQEGVRATWHGRAARVLHFNGLGRHKYPEARGLYACVTKPLAAPSDGEAG